MAAITRAGDGRTTAPCAGAPLLSVRAKRAFGLRENVSEDGGAFGNESIQRTLRSFNSSEEVDSMHVMYRINIPPAPTLKKQEEAESWQKL